MQITIGYFFVFFLTSFLTAISIVTGTEQRDAGCRLVPVAKEAE
jgi:hypothetical protein